ncbi:hypothetical protein [Desulfosporosinus sp. FKB]|uniref:hypothetical protein n=1 Tax=Desulfosporosinus sp. FKB TaxID=1969835 RepID=UPI000B49F523|nr:hypothetical protein [Desulfosporosinus sp. FKB]
MDLGISNQCQDIYEKTSINLAHFKEMLELTQKLESKSLDNELELSKEILEQRQGVIDQIDQVNIEIDLLQSKIIQKIGQKNFNLESIQSYISEDLYKNLKTRSAMIRELILQIQNLDKEYLKNAKMVREGAKLQLLRVRSVLHPGRFYHKVYAPEPRFVDKKR